VHVRYGEEVLRATRTPLGPATMHVRRSSDAESLEVQAWGPGRDWIIDEMPSIVGALDDISGLATQIEGASGPGAAVVRRLYKQFRGLRIPRTMAVSETLVPVILEQKVASTEAHRSYRQLVMALGEPAPGPPELISTLMVPPSARLLYSTPYWKFHQFGVERKRAEVIRLACSYSGRLERLVDLAPAEARERLTALDGIGPWSAAEVALVALGDADAVSLGDFHLPHNVAWALTGERRGDDETMLRLLEPYRGHRGRVTRIIEAGVGGPPRRGPRMAVRSIRDR
jgi:3-methyladenine DNA glycosylase/8-oxoguanine DNA glycosylase